MSDQAASGSVEQAAPVPAGAPTGAAPPPSNGSSGAGDNTPFSGLSEGTRKWVETKGYKSLEDVASSALGLEQKLGTMVNVPAADASQEDWDKFVSRLPEARRPIEAPEKLEFKRPEGLPENLPYNEELANAAKPWMHEAGLTAGQAQTMHDKFAGYMAEQATAYEQTLAKSVTETHDALVKEWGPVDSPAFKEKLAIADRAMKGLGLVDAYKAKNILLADGSLTDPQIAKAFLAIGEKMFKDDTIGAGDLALAGNPFKRNADGERDLKGISALVKRDPQAAARLAREAGENPAVWLGTNPL
jgi:hypothetical protein